jgi:hypothetical protein
MSRQLKKKKEAEEHNRRQEIRRRREDSLAKWIQSEMPWPYADIDRDSDEARQEAFELALDLLPMIERAWRLE